MSEGDMWQKVRPLMKGMDPVRIESHMESGIPDVNYVLGWVELKFKAAWPKRASTPLRIEHFTQEQRVWLTRRADAKGRVFLLLQVGNDWLLFLGVVAARFVGYVPKQELLELCLQHWSAKPSREDLWSWLMRK